MTVIDIEGKFNDNSYLIDTRLMNVEKNLAHYVVENDNMRLMIDIGISSIPARKMVKRMKDMGIYPIHKIILTHSHWDHMQGVEKIKKLMKETDIEIMASEKALNSLKNPNPMNDVFKNDFFKFHLTPTNDVIPLKEGDIIDLNGLKLEILNFFGHTPDCIAVFDEKNKNIFVGDAIINVIDNKPYLPPFMPPAFNEEALLETYQKLRNMKNKLNSISLGHFGVLTDEDFNRVIDEMEEFYFKVKDSIIKWYHENPSIESITSKYIKTIIANPDIPVEMFKMPVGWLVKGLEMSGFIKN